MTTPSAPTAAELLAGLVPERDEFLAFVERRVGDRSHAEDLLQEAFAKGDGVAVEDYAAELGITANNAAVRVHRARKALDCADCSCDP